jgi:hypothetical protein
VRLQLELIAIRERELELEEQADAAHARVMGEPLYEFIPRVTGGRYAPPYHLDPLVEIFEAAWSGSVWCTAHAPPRHAKTETVLAFLAQTLQKFPTKHVVYVSYSQTIADDKSRKARDYAIQAGVQLRAGDNRADKWSTVQGGSFRGVGIGAGLTGHGADILVVDDPYKDRGQAESGAWRRRVFDWWNDVGLTRIEPGGSGFIFHTRWVTDDLIGGLHKQDALFESGGMWRNIVMPAIAEQDEPVSDAVRARRPHRQARKAGEPLWPQRISLAFLARHQRNPHKWSSLYQGSPKPRGGIAFGPPCYYRGDPPAEGRDVIGLDFAYTAKTRSDWSVAAVLRGFGSAQYLLRVVRRQVKAEHFAGDLRELKRDFPTARFVAYIGGGPERGVVDLLNAILAEAGIFIEAYPATTDKLVRAGPTIARWGAEEILIPGGAEYSVRRACPACQVRLSVGQGACDEHKAPEWVDTFIGETETFTGEPGGRDDQIDGLAAGSDALGAFTDPPDADDFFVGGQRGGGR